MKAFIGGCCYSATRGFGILPLDEVRQDHPTCLRAVCACVDRHTWVAVKHNCVLSGKCKIV